MGLFLGVLRKTICLWPTFGFLYQSLKRKKQNILSDCLNFLCCCKIYFLTKWPFYHNFVFFERNADSYFPCIVVIQWNSIFIFNPDLPILTLLWGLCLQDGLINLISRKQLYLTKLCKSVLPVSKPEASLMHSFRIAWTNTFCLLLKHATWLSFSSGLFLCKKIGIFWKIFYVL